MVFGGLSSPVPRNGRTKCGLKMCDLQKVRVDVRIRCVSVSHTHPVLLHGIHCEIMVNISKVMICHPFIYIYTYIHTHEHNVCVCDNVTTVCVCVCVCVCDSL